MFLQYPLDVIRFNLARRFNRPLKPRFINFLLTYRCNSRCKMCRVWDVYSQNPALLKEELSVSEIDRFLARDAEYLSELRNLGLSGGDPLLMRSDFVEVVRVIKSRLPAAHLGVQTNGLIPSLAYERLKEILSFCPDFSIAVSIDGIGPTHDEVRGVQGAFEKATQTIRLAQKLGIGNITAGMTISRYNYGQIRQVRDYIESLGVEFSCFPLEVADYFNNQNLDSLQLDRAQWSEVIRQLREYCGYHYYMDNLRLQLERKRRRHLSCFSGFTSLVIDPYGNVKPCVLKVKGIEDDVFGNIRDSSLKEMLTSARADKIREKIKRCSCWCQCEVSSSVVVSPFDILNWFMLYCRDKKNFIGHLLTKRKKYSSLA